MEHIPGWERSEREKVPGMHPDYCDADRRVKRPWIRTEIPNTHLSPTLDFDCKDSPFCPNIPNTFPYNPKIFWLKGKEKQKAQYY